MTSIMTSSGSRTITDSGSGSGSNGTYEATRARQSTQYQPDKIVWEAAQSVREAPYRLLHHQHGIIGHVKLQLLEAAALKRNYWSALALGPVKHLGLSKAHGQVSSFVVLSINHTNSSSSSSSNATFQSPVVPNSNDPVWHACQGTLTIHKGRLVDGMPVMLHVKVMEDVTAAEGLVFLGPSDQDRVLGIGQLDVTDLVLGTTTTTTTTTSGGVGGGGLHVGVVDAWIPIYKEHNHKNEPTGRVRIMLQYTPHGLTPQPQDLVAFEAFARPRADSSVSPILPPLQPMRVLQTRGAWLLVEYYTRLNPVDATDRDGTVFRAAAAAAATTKKATMRLHRNAVFCIERSTVLDAAVRLVLLPADIVMSTPLGQHAAHVATPWLQAAGDVIMPALLTARLIVMAVRTTGTAAWSGVGAGVGAIVAQSRQGHQMRQQQQSFHGRV